MALTQISAKEKKRKPSKLETFANITGIAGSVAGAVKNLSSLGSSSADAATGVGSGSTKYDVWDPERYPMRKK